MVPITSFPVTSPVSQTFLISISRTSLVIPIISHVILQFAVTQLHFWVGKELYNKQKCSDCLNSAFFVQSLLLITMTIAIDFCSSTLLLGRAEHCCTIFFLSTGLTWYCGMKLRVYSHFGYSLHEDFSCKDVLHLLSTVC